MMLRRLITPATVQSLRATVFSRSSVSAALPQAAPLSSFFRAASQSSLAAGTQGVSRSQSSSSGSSLHKRWFSIAEEKKAEEEDAGSDPKEVSEQEQEQQGQEEAKNDDIDDLLNEVGKKDESSSESPRIDNEVIVGNAEAHDFKAETRKILDIVAKSLYSDRQVRLFSPLFFILMRGFDFRGLTLWALVLLMMMVVA